jgi:hypothetical protein
MEWLRKMQACITINYLLVIAGKPTANLFDDTVIVTMVDCHAIMYDHCIQGVNSAVIRQLLSKKKDMKK